MYKLTYLMIVICLLTACSASTGKSYPEGTLFLGEVVQVLSSGEVEETTYFEGTAVPKLDENVFDLCDNIIKTDELALLRYAYRWNDSSIVFPVIKTVPVSKETELSVGNIVESEIIRSSEAGSCERVTRVRHAELAAGQCNYLRTSLGSSGPRQLFLGRSLTNFPGSASLSCPGLRKEKWTPKLAGPDGASLWTKPPE